MTGPVSTFENKTGMRADVVGLLVASLACVAILSVAVIWRDGSAAGIARLSLGSLLTLAVLAGAIVFSAFAIAILVRRTREAQWREQKALGEAQALRQSLEAAKAVIRAEPQILILWETGRNPRIIAHTLRGTTGSAIPGLPFAAGEILDFASWLSSGSWHEFDGRLTELFRSGRAFNIFVTTRAGAPCEIDGRTAGGHAVLRIRDVAGQRLDLAGISEENRKLKRLLRTNRALLQALPMPAWLRSGEGRILWVNEAYVAAVEAESAEHVVAQQIELLESRQREAIAKAHGEGRTFRQRIHVIVAGKRQSYDLISLTHEGLALAIAMDVAALESAKGELDRQVAAYHRTLDRVATAVAIFGPDQRLRFCNEAYHRLWQLDREWLETGPRDAEILDRLLELGRLPRERDYAKWKENILAVYGTRREYEDWWHVAGRTLHVVAEQRADGGVTYLYDDVTERLELESRFNALIRVQRETLDHLSEGVAVFNMDGRLRLFNPAFARIWKLGPQDLEQSPHVEEVVQRCRVLFDDETAWPDVLRAVTAMSEKRQRISGQMNRPDGSVIAYAGLPLPDGATLLTFIDITDSKRVERVLRERNEALEAADRLKSTFVKHVSYELRTPLNNIIGFSELLASPRTGALNPKQREYVGDINASSMTLKAIIDDILDLTTIDAGALELKCAPIDAEEIIEAAVAGVRERVRLARLTLDIEVGDDVGRFVADERRVKQVLYNLLSNAIGFSEPGQAIRIRCWREDGHVHFAVEDEGPGIPPDFRELVFERFESRPHGSKHRGAGLGLSLVKSLVELHGGSVELVCEADKGTTVIVRFPETAHAQSADSLGRGRAA